MGCNFPAQSRVSSQSSSSAPGIYSFLRFIDQSRGSHFKSRFIHQHFFLNFTWIPFHIVPPSSPHHQARAQQRADTPSSIALFKVEVVVDAASCYLAIIQYCHSFIYPFHICQIFAFCPKCISRVSLPTTISLVGYLHCVEMSNIYLPWPGSR